MILDVSKNDGIHGAIHGSSGAIHGSMEFPGEFGVRMDGCTPECQRFRWAPGKGEIPKNKPYVTPGIPTIKAMGVNITTIVYLRVLIIEIGSTIILMVVEAQGYVGIYGWWNFKYFFYFHRKLGKWSNLTHIFQRGWNHQPGIYGLPPRILGERNKYHGYTARGAPFAQHANNVASTPCRLPTYSPTRSPNMQIM